MHHPSSNGIQCVLHSILYEIVCKASRTSSHTHSEMIHHMKRLFRDYSLDTSIRYVQASVIPGVILRIFFLVQVCFGQQHRSSRVFRSFMFSPIKGDLERCNGSRQWYKNHSGEWPGTTCVDNTEASLARCLVYARSRGARANGYSPRNTYKHIHIQYHMMVWQAQASR